MTSITLGAEAIVPPLKSCSCSVHCSGSCSIPLIRPHGTCQTCSHVRDLTKSSRRSVHSTECAPSPIESSSASPKYSPAWPSESGEYGECGELASGPIGSALPTAR